MVVGKGALVDDFGAEFDQALEEAFRHGDAGDGTDPKAPQVGEGFFLASEEVFEVEGVVAAGVDGGVKVVAADLFFQLGVFIACAFGEEDKVGPAKGIGGFAKDAAGQDVLVAEGVLSVDEKEVEAVAEAEVLEAVVQEEGVGTVVADGMAGGFDAVGIDEDGDAREVAGEHEGFVAGLCGIEKNGFSVGDDAGGRRGAAREKLVGEAGEEGFGDAFISAAEDGNAAARFLERAGEFFNDGGLAGSAHGEVADADDHHADRVAAKEGILVEAGADPHDACVEGGEQEKKGFEKGGPATCGTIEDDIGRKLFEGFESFQCHD